MPTGRAGVCFKPPAGQPFAEMQAELEQLLATPDDPDDTAVTAGPAGSAGSNTAPPAADSAVVRHVGDKFGYRWILVEATAVDDLVTRVHMVHSSLQDAGWSTQLLCSVFGFAPGPAADGTPSRPRRAHRRRADPTCRPITEPVYLVYLAKQGTFYPFAPPGQRAARHRAGDAPEERLAGDLPVEPDLSRWFPIWDLPLA